MLDGDSVTRSARLARIQNLLYQNSRGLTTRELAGACGVSVRSIQRDLLALHEAGVPVDQEGHRYRIQGGYFVPPVHLTLPEATALFLAARLLHRCSDEENPCVAGALVKLANVLPPPVGEQLQAALAETMQPQAGDGSFARVFQTVAECWAMRRRVRIWYRRAGQAEVGEYMLAPYVVEPGAPGLAVYVIGDAGPSRGIRTFKLERMLRAEATAESFVVPDDFDPGDYLSTAWGIMGGGPPVEIAVRFTPKVAMRVRESVWHRSQELEPTVDGGVILRLRIGHSIEIVPWLRGWGPDAEVLEPLELREQIAADMRRAAGRYDGAC